MTSSIQQPRATGGCLCGAVRYEIHGSMRPVVACHCTQCRRTSGHHVAATAVRAEHLRLVYSAGLRWYASNPNARRGFCGRCGSNLFWEPRIGEHVSIMAGTLDGPTGLATAVHIHTADAGDYYRIADGVPRKADGNHGVAVPEI